MGAGRTGQGGQATEAVAGGEVVELGAEEGGQGGVGWVGVFHVKQVGAV